LLEQLQVIIYRIL